jgi:hypothetical protein
MVIDTADAPEPHDAYGDAQVHAAHQRVLQEGRQPHSSHRPALPPIAPHFLHYNFARLHTTLADPYPRTPAVVAGIADHVWSMTEITALPDEGHRRYVT